jgi:hypothetical protein
MGTWQTVIGSTSLMVMAGGRIASGRGFDEAVDIVTKADLRVTDSARGSMDKDSYKTG